MKGVADRVTGEPPGMTLVEVMIALGVIAVALPLIFGVMAASSSSRREAEMETRAPFVAEQLFADVPRAWNGQGLWIEQELSLEFGTQVGAELAFGVKANGELGRKLTAQEYVNGVSADEFAFVARVSGGKPDQGDEKLENFDSEILDEQTCEITVELSHPAVAPQTSRQTLSFVTFKKMEK